MFLKVKTDSEGQPEEDAINSYPMVCLEELNKRPGNPGPGILVDWVAAAGLMGDLPRGQLRGVDLLHSSKLAHAGSQTKTKQIT